MKEKRHILIAVAGLTPQVITETIYCFYRIRKPRVRISEVIVITTDRGKEKIKRELIEEGKFSALEKILKTRIRFGEDNIYIITDKQGNPLNDIRTLEDNERVGEKIWEIVERFTSDPDVCVHCSVAGGRKTMGVYAAICMSILGREGDTLSHVLVDEDKESSNFYFPRNKEEERKLSLAEIPYVRLREVLKIEVPQSRINFVQRIKEYQEQLKGRIFPEIVIDYEEKKVRAGEWGMVKLSENEFILYSFLAERHKECQCENGCDVCFLDIGDILKNIKEHYEKYRRYFRYFYNVHFWDGVNAKNRTYEIISRINSKIEKANILNKSLFKIQTLGEWRSYRYGLKIPKEYLRLERE